MSTRIPRTDEPFNNYIRSTANALAAGMPTGADRLGLTAQQAAAWETYRTNWDIEYTLYVDESTRTTTVTNAKNRIRKEFIEFASTLLIAFSVHPNLTDADRLTFKLPEPDRTPTARGKITDLAYAIIVPVGGGSIQVKVRTNEDASRASRHRLADAVEVRYALLTEAEANSTPPASGNDTRVPGVNTLPVNAMDCPLVLNSTKASFRIELGPQHSGKRFYAFFRWVNLSRPANSGDFGQLYQTLVL
jgi:hypothetical protein